MQGVINIQEFTKPGIKRNALSYLLDEGRVEPYRYFLFALC
jgi:hypothetical protein